MSNKMITNAISAVLAMSLSGISTDTLAEEIQQPTISTVHMVGEIDGMEKCYGVAKAARNDCGTASHSCAGESKIDHDKEAWIQVPSGLCNKIAGSSVNVPEKS